MHEEVGRALHVDVELFLVDAKRTVLRHVGDTLPPLALPSTIADLVLADSRPMEIDLRDQRSPFFRLPESEESWLRSGDFRLLVPLNAAGGRRAGVIAVSGKRSDLAFSDEDRRPLSTIAATASLALDSCNGRRPGCFFASTASSPIA